jgi:hypothetical protein
MCTSMSFSALTDFLKDCDDMCMQILSCSKEPLLKCCCSNLHVEVARCKSVSLVSCDIQNSCKITNLHVIGLRRISLISVAYYVTLEPSASPH